MAKQFKQLDSGLMVPYWHSPKRDRRAIRRDRDFMFTPSGACGCCKTCMCVNTAIIPNDTVTWRDYEIGDESVEVADKSADCVTYFVQSTGGSGRWDGPVETGNGSASNPWNNLNTAFSDYCILHMCSSAECPMVRIRVSGTIDYTLTPRNNFYRKLVVEPNGVASISVRPSNNYSGVDGQNSGTNAIFKNLEVESTCSTDAYGNPSGITNCYGCLFDSCSVMSSHTGTRQYSTTSAAWYYSPHSTFLDCQGVITGDVTNLSLSAFMSCANSIFLRCEGTAAPVATGYGFFGCSSSVFDTCTAEASGVAACGFRNTSPTYWNCDTSDPIPPNNPNCNQV